MTKQQTKERILGAAATLFAERGYVGTTTSAIADAAGVNEVTLFRHFDSKLGVVQALGATLDVSERPYPPADAVVEGDLLATLQNLAALEIEAALASGGLVLRLSFDARAVPELGAAMGRVSGSNVERLTAWLQGCRERGQLRRDLSAAQVAEAFFSLTSTLVMARMAIGAAGPSGDEIAELAERQMRLLWSGIEPRQD